MARKTQADSPAPPDFETSLQELEVLVARLERGDLPLEDALRDFERGVTLTRQCQESLSSAQQRVEILLQQGGQSRVAEFDAGDSDDADA